MSSRKTRRFRLGLDCDGVVYNFVDTLRNWIHLETGKPLEEMPDAETWNFFTDQWGLTFQEYKDLTISGIDAGVIFAKGKPIPGAIEAIHSLSHDYEIILVTSRSGFGLRYEQCRENTLKWLADNKVWFDGVIFAEDKTNRGIDILLDDAPHQVGNAVAVDERVVVFDQPWNRHVEHQDRVMDWEDFELYIRNRFPV